MASLLLSVAGSHHGRSLVVARLQGSTTRAAFPLYAYTVHCLYGGTATFDSVPSYHSYKGGVLTTIETRI